MYNRLLNCEVPDIYTVIGIDCGSTGSISYLTPNSFEAFKMPKTTSKDVLLLIQNLIKRSESDFKCKPFVILEKVGGRKDTKGGAFTDGKLMEGYGFIQGVLIAEDLDFFKVHPMTWKSSMGLQITKEDRQIRKIENTESNRKQKTIDFIKKRYPSMTVRKYACDGIALAMFGKFIFDGKLYKLNPKCFSEIKRTFFLKDSLF